MDKMTWANIWLYIVGIIVGGIGATFAPVWDLACKEFIKKHKYWYVRKRCQTCKHKEVIPYRSPCKNCKRNISINLCQREDFKYIEDNWEVKK